MNKSKPKTKGPWIHRFAIRFFTVVLAILIYWLLGFVVDDIGSIEGPKYDTIEKRHLDAALIAKQTDLEKKIGNVTRKIEEQRGKQNVLGESTRSLQTTINQLLELQRLSKEKNIALSESEQKTFAESFDLFLSNQKRDQTINQEIAKLVDEKQALEMEKRGVDQTLEDQREPARKEFEKLNRKHDLKLASMQLGILIPILVFAAVLIVRLRASIYFPIFLAFGISTLLKVSLVIHEYFPSRLFKYALILVFLVAVTKLLAYFIKSIAFPKAQWLVKQYREAYERFLCPVCEYPIRRGPMKFLFWNRNSVKKLKLPRGTSEDDDSRYVCPACSTELFEECSSCHKIRHALLPSCEHCGNEKEIEASRPTDEAS